MFDELLTTNRSGETDTSVDFESVINGGNDGLVPNIDKSRSYTDRLGVTVSNSQLGHAFVNGKHFDVDEVG
jgi:hypothetical protein